MWRPGDAERSEAGTGDPDAAPDPAVTVNEAGEISRE